ncbi:hypothetical protein F4821DRAFT_280974 [Hypoxylon rubiginosum]|uniref:Uncharacterized protein n=1 Tax=Hypoxylon rubiginosum TaxID=110542 RepID=A0ACC0CSL3_9PEZI|nr:hypothetical protein F4821DRAFT_280974 [Hypoxylon rubiginosum]
MSKKKGGKKKGESQPQQATAQAQAQAQAQAAMPPPPQPQNQNQQQQQQKQQSQGAWSSYVPEQLPAISKLDQSLGEIIQQQTSRAAKRKRDSATSSVVDFPAGASVSGQSDTGDMPVAKRPALHSVRMSDVVRHMNHGVARSLEVRSDPDLPNWEATGGTSTMAGTDNPETMLQIVGNVIERNYRINNNVFKPMNMTFFQKRKTIHGARNLSERRNSLFPGNTRRIEDLGEVEREEDVRMEDVGSAAALTTAPTTTATPASRSPAPASVVPVSVPAPAPTTVAAPAPAVTAAGAAQGSTGATEGGKQQQSRRRRNAKKTHEQLVQEVEEELDQQMRDYWNKGNMEMQQ